MVATTPCFPDQDRSFPRPLVFGFWPYSRVRLAVKLALLLGSLVVILVFAQPRSSNICVCLGYDADPWRYLAWNTFFVFLSKNIPQNKRLFGGGSCNTVTTSRATHLGLGKTYAVAASFQAWAPLARRCSPASGRRAELDGGRERVLGGSEAAVFVRFDLG